MSGKQCRLIRRHIVWHLIWVYTVCSGLSVPILKIIMVILHVFHSFMGVVGCGKGVVYILHHGGVQLRLAYSWARPAILVAGKGRGGMFLFLLFFFTFICVSLSSRSLSFISSTISSISFLPFSGRCHKMTHKG